MMNREEMKREMLSKVNVEAINAYISKTDSAATYDANVTKILEAWAENKVDIYVKFGRQLKIEKEVECNIPENQCRKLREDFIEEYKEPKYILANAFVKTIKLAESSNNYLDRDYYLLGTKFAKGMRVSRCFRQLLPGKDVDDYQTKFSMFIQKFKVHGKAVISIDPMDYLTMSVNNSGWRSCHIISNGIHKAGCISYMIDPSTAIAYTTDKVITANKKFEGLAYDNKIWRQCVHIGENFALQARQYPGINPSNGNAVGELLADMFNTFFDTDSFSHQEKSQYDIYKYQHDNDGNAIVPDQWEGNGGFMLDASIGKLIRLKKGQLSINLTLTNILNNRDICTGGYEQSRSDLTSSGNSRGYVFSMNPKKFYAYGTNGMLNFTYRF